MRRILLLFTAAAMMSVVLGMSAGPASAQDWSSWNWDHDRSPWWFGHHDRFDGDDFGGLDFDDQRLESGDIDNETDISIDGNNNNQCVGLSQFGNTGNFANQQGTTFGDGGDHNGDDDDDWWNWNWNRDDDDDNFRNGNGEFDSEFNGPEFNFDGDNETTCEQAVQQASSASSSW